MQSSAFGLERAGAVRARVFRAAARRRFVPGWSDEPFGSRRVSMVKNLYVGNLPFTTTDENLRAEFAKFGTVVKAQVVMDRETGRSRGFGFVEMSDGADEAIAALNGAVFQGRTLTVNEARPREPRQGGGGFGGGGGGGGGGRRGGFGGGGGGGDRPYGNRGRY